MISPETLVGLFAAACTTISYFPQLLKVWQTGSTEDLSLKMLAILITGLATWVVYGFLKGDIVIVIANSVSTLCVGTLTIWKLNEVLGYSLFKNYRD